MLVHQRVRPLEGPSWCCLKPLSHSTDHPALHENMGRCRGFLKYFFSRDLPSCRNPCDVCSKDSSWKSLQCFRRCLIHFAMISPWFPRIFPSFSMIFQDFPMIFPSFSHDFPTISRSFPGFSHDFPRIFPWFSRIFPGFSQDFPMIFPGFSHDFPGFSHDFPGFSHDFPTISRSICPCSCGSGPAPGRSATPRCRRARARPGRRSAPRWASAATAATPSGDGWRRSKRQRQRFLRSFFRRIWPK